MQHLHAVVLSEDQYGGDDHHDPVRQADRAGRHHHLQVFSNLNVSAYSLRSYNLAAFAGQTVTIKFTGVEDASLQTSFVIDDTSLTVS